MGILLVVSKIVHRKSDTISIIMLSLLIILILNPFAINDIGLQLSFGGTIGIVLFNRYLNKFFEKKIRKKIKNKKMQKVLEKLAEFLSVTLSAQIVIFPITMIHFNTLSLTFFISNILASSIMGLIMLLGFISVITSYIFIPIGEAIGVISNLLLEALKLIAKVVANMPFSNILVTTPSILLVLTYYIILFLIYKYLKLSKTKIFFLSNPQKKVLKKIKVNKQKIFKFLIIFTILIISISYIYKLLPKDLCIYFIDVGQRRLYISYYTI